MSSRVELVLLFHALHVDGQGRWAYMRVNVHGGHAGRHEKVGRNAFQTISLHTISTLI